jgi:hypothetical protein
LLLFFGVAKALLAFAPVLAGRRNPGPRRRAETCDAREIPKTNRLTINAYT